MNHARFRLVARLRWGAAACAAAAAAVTCLSLSACVNGFGPIFGTTKDASDADLRDGEADRSAWFDRDEAPTREVDRLRADLRAAEEAMVAIESGRGSEPSRADAASALAEARISVERAGQRAPWLEKGIDDARGKLEEAERQLQIGNVGSAVFFASRAKRMVETVLEDGERLAGSPGARFVNADRAKLRAGPSTTADVLALLTEATPVLPQRKRGNWAFVRTPSGTVGWIHRSLIRTR
ncbi:MAG: SH3 domain-containing protein [Myxococcales bacterium]|nr:SH3 domain-containing protein [Myxococcales bacterium]